MSKPPVDSLARAEIAWAAHFLSLAVRGLPPGELRVLGQDALTLTELLQKSLPPKGK
jgi:hypothetical protein